MLQNVLSNAPKSISHPSCIGQGPQRALVFYSTVTSRILSNGNGGTFLRNQRKFLRFLVEVLYHLKIETIDLRIKNVIVVIQI